MIKKDKLLDRLNELMNLEKSLIPLLNRHISSSLFLSDLKEEDRKRIVEYFQSMAIRQTKHVEMLDELKDEVAGGIECAAHAIRGSAVNFGATRRPCVWKRSVGAEICAKLKTLIPRLKMSSNV